MLCESWGLWVENRICSSRSKMLMHVKSAPHVKGLGEKVDFLLFLIVLTPHSLSLAYKE